MKALHLQGCLLRAVVWEGTPSLGGSRPQSACRRLEARTLPSHRGVCVAPDKARSHFRAGVLL